MTKTNSVEEIAREISNRHGNKYPIEGQNDLEKAIIKALTAQKEEIAALKQAIVDAPEEFIRYHHNPIVAAKNKEITELEKQLTEAKADKAYWKESSDKLHNDIIQLHQALTASKEEVERLKKERKDSLERGKQFVKKVTSDNLTVGLKEKLHGCQVQHAEARLEVLDWRSRAERLERALVQISKKTKVIMDSGEVVLSDSANIAKDALKQKEKE